MQSATLRALKIYFDDTPALPRWGIIGGSRVVEERFFPALYAILREHRSGLGAESVVHAIYSRTRHHARQIADRHAIPFSGDDLSALLEDHTIQIIYIASHPSRHAEQTAAALRAGKHVLCEAPLALNAEEAETLTAMAANRSLALAINQITRGTPALQRARLLLDEEILGDLLGIEISNLALLPLAQQTWRLQPDGGGVGFERTLQSLDALTFLLRDQVFEVNARQGQRILGDDAMVMEELFTLARLRRHPFRAQLHDALLVPHASERVDIHGSHASMTIHHWSGREKKADSVVLTRAGRPQVVPVAHDISWTDEPFALSVGQLWAVAGGLAIPPLLDGRTHVELLRVLQLIEQAARSERDQRRSEAGHV
jgi:1,5-anhydro-D-fructose reductase (1,5-anhydro-D-mannitol-forming)